jgi:hypothetical protein
VDEQARGWTCVSNPTQVTGFNEDGSWLIDPLAPFRHFRQPAKFEKTCGAFVTIKKGVGGKPGDVFFLAPKSCTLVSPQRDFYKSIL